MDGAVWLVKRWRIGATARRLSRRARTARAGSSRSAASASVRRARETVSGRLVAGPEAAIVYAEALARVGRGAEAKEALASLGDSTPPPEGLDYLRLWIQHHLDDVPPGGVAAAAAARKLIAPESAEGVPLRELMLAAQVLWSWNPGHPDTLDALARLREQDSTLAVRVTGGELSPK